MNTLMKRLTAALVSGALILSLAACQQTPASSGSAAPEATPEASGSASSEASAPPSSASEAGGAEVPVYSAPLDDNGYFKGVTALDYVTLPDLTALTPSQGVGEITDEAYAAELENRLAENTVQKQVTDRAVQNGDTVNIDYVGSVDGVEFTGGSTYQTEEDGSKTPLGTTVTIGVTNYIDDFLQQLIGHKPGETINVNVTFPEDYGKDELNGKDALFVTTINYIVEDVVPTLTDDFVATHWKVPYGWENTAQAEAGIREEMRISKVGSDLWDQIQQQAQVTQVPEAFLQYQRDVVASYYTSRAQSYGMELEEFLQNAVGVSSMDEVFEQTKSSLESNAKASLIMQALGEQLKLTPTNEDISAYFGRTTGSVDWSVYLESYGRPYLALLTREDMAKRALADL